jgi:nucleotide-binding universal stress UspA family protein
VRRSTTGVGRFKLGETMYRRMLVPLDGSKTAEKVLPYARWLGSTKSLLSSNSCGRHGEARQELTAGATSEYSVS